MRMTILNINSDYGGSFNYSNENFKDWSSKDFHKLKKLILGTQF